jgi:3-phosphoglycerate kinase
MYDLLSLFLYIMTNFHQIGSSLFDKPGAEKVEALLKKAADMNIKVILPVDYIIADKFDKDAKVSTPCPLFYCYNCSG